MEFERSDRPAVPLLIGVHGTAPEVADFMIASLGEIEAALAPVVGTRGVLALLARSVHLAGARHPWLRSPVPGTMESLDSGALRRCVAEQPLDDATAGADDLLRTVRTLLSSLIGASLADQLLEPAWRRFAARSDESAVAR